MTTTTYLIQTFKKASNMSTTKVVSTCILCVMKTKDISRITHGVTESKRKTGLSFGEKINLPKSSDKSIAWF